MKHRRQKSLTATSPRFRGLWGLFVFFLLQTVAGGVQLWAGDPPPGEALCRPYTEDGLLMIDIEVLTLFNEEVRETLGSGFTSTVATRLLLGEVASGRLVAENRFSREIRFDVWDETYLVTTYSNQGTGRQLAATLEEVETFCRRTTEFRICELDRLVEGTAYRFTMEILLVPISQEQLEQTKRWVEESGSAGDDSGRQGAMSILFGSMMNIFIGRSTGVEEDRLTFVTAPFQLADVERPAEEVVSDE